MTTIAFMIHSFIQGNGNYRRQWSYRDLEESRSSSLSL